MNQYELNKFLWPMFVHSYLELVEGKYPDEAKTFLDTFKTSFEVAHADDLKLLATITLPSHVEENSTTKLFKTTKYRIPVTDKAHDLMLAHMEKDYEAGGQIILRLLASYCTIPIVDRGLANPYSFAAIGEKQKSTQVSLVELQEGVPGAFEGVRTDATPSGPLRLGPLALDPDLQREIRSELVQEDQRNPPADGQLSLVEEFENKIKREESADGPTRAQLPLPAYRSRDVLNEVEKLKEHRDRFRIEGRTGGVGTGVSVTMFTFHNSLGRYESHSPLSLGLSC